MNTPTSTGFAVRPSSKDKSEMSLAPVHCFIQSPPSSAYNRGRAFFTFARSHPSPYPLVTSLPKSLPFKTCCTEKENKDALSQPQEEFSVLSSDIPWDSGSTWSTMALYFFSFHIPLSFGGLSVIAQVLQQPVIDPQTEALSLLLLQTTELLGAFTLLQYTAKTQYKLATLFLSKKPFSDRNWILGSALGFGFLLLVVILTSLLADRLSGPKDVSNPVLKAVLSSGFVAKAACFFIYCFITPILEEIVYRGFLLRSLAATMEWRRAVAISACVFTAAHLSWENSPQLFFIGCVLGSAYCWTGNLASSFTIHAAYNALTLLVAILS